jgi:hypothetical protein
MRRRFLLRLALTAIASVFATSSCLSPTLPLPPPEVETSTQSMTDPTKWIVTGTCSPGALVTVLNDETGQGVVYEDRAESGHWLVEIEADRCDSAWASQERGNEESSRTGFIVDEVTIDNPAGSGLCD